MRTCNVGRETVKANELYDLSFNLFDFVAAESKWEELHPGGERPPALQEHSAVAYKDCLYVFGGELGFSAGTETPLWVYNVKVKRNLPRPSCSYLATSNI